MKTGDSTFPCTCCCGKNQGDIPWHWHEEIELIYITKGVVRCAAGSKRFLLLEGEGALINAGVPHSLYEDPGSSYEKMDVIFHPRLLCNDADNACHSQYLTLLKQSADFPCFIFHADIPWQNTILNFIREIIDFCTEKSELYEFNVRNLLTYTCMLLYKHQQEQIPQTPQYPDFLMERLKLMLDYFQKHYPENITLDDLAAQANICKRECQRTFKTILGITPTQYFEQYRLALSVQRLSLSDDSIQEIAINCGFRSSSYFTMLFGRRYGMTPSAYRGTRSALHPVSPNE
jgi:AraC-like DNA-binding protein